MTLSLCCDSVPNFREDTFYNTEPHGETHTDESHTCLNCGGKFDDTEDLTHEVLVVCDYCGEVTDDAEQTLTGRGDLVWRCLACQIKQDPEREED